MHRSHSRRVSSALFSVLTSLTLILSVVPPVTAQAPEPAPVGKAYRAQITLSQPHDLARVQGTGATVFSHTGDQAVVFVTEDQLATLARWRMKPTGIDSVDALRGLAGMSGEVRVLAKVASPDSDGDGLTDQEEGFWCTDPHNANSDSPLPPSATNPSDGDEVKAIMNGITAYGPPFALWPRFTPYYSDGTCPDGDFDGVPDQAEEFMIGTSPLRESSDKDKFDDGQELFGVTFCPGAAGACGYGILPRAEDAAWVSANMPAWVLPPGNSPWVAAFPEPEVEVVPSSIKMTAKTTIQTGKTINEGEEHTYGSANTKGTGSSVGDTTTWNTWQEVSVTSPATQNAAAERRATDASMQSPSAPTLDEIRTQNMVTLKAGNDFGCEVINSLAAGACNLVKTGVTYAGEEIKLRTMQAKYIWNAFSPKKDCIQSPVPGTELPANVDVCQGETEQNKLDQNTRPTVLLAAPSSPIASMSFSIKSQDLAAGGAGHLISSDTQSGLTTQSMYQGSYPAYQSVPMTTAAQGVSYGGAKTVTTSQYEEQTISESSTKQFSTSWANATAMDTAHAADLRFTYNIVNNGTEYAREISSLLFNIYIGDDPDPAYTYVAVGETGQIAKIENLFPKESKTFTSNPVPLTLDEMKAIDLGAPIRIAMEDVAFGQDQAFYQDAVNGSVTVAMEDGFDDRDETIDTYLIAVWAPTDTVQDVLKRYFPVTEDSEGNILSISTPEFDKNPPTFHTHALAGTDWWNIYMSEGLNYTGSFKDVLAKPNSTVLVRILSDKDRDGYNDRTEIKLGTDPNDPASHPTPELLAGYTTTCNGNNCTSLMSLLNTGNYDAYGVEAIMYSPDGLSQVTNNTIGGSGRVPAGAQVVLGNRVLAPELTTWTGGAKPFSTGNYLGSADRTYVFTAQSAGNIGSGALNFAWTDGQGGSGAVSFGAGYQAPLPVDVAQGVQIGFQSGSVSAGQSFTVKAQTPRDTFQYTTQSSAAEPVIVVSYNDPQGNHRFVLPSGVYPAGAHLAALDADLKPLSGQMLLDPGVDIASTSASLGSFVLNAPHTVPITDSRLFVEYITQQGRVDREDVFTQTLPTGPTVISVTVDTARFNPPDYNILAFMTDSQGNIIDSSARPLASFGPDPLPEANLSARPWQVGRQSAVNAVPDPWSFGAVKAGVTLHAPLTLANTGLGSLRYALTGLGSGLAVDGSPAGSLGPTESRAFEVTLDTSGLAPGVFSRTLTLRTSDPKHPTFAIHLTGTVGGAAAGTGTAYPVDAYRPWDQLVHVAGPHSLNDTIVFTHTIADQAARMHPLYLYTEDGQTLKGVGEYGPDFTGTTAPFGVFGDGADGDLVVGSGQTKYTDDVRSALGSTANAGQKNITLSSTSVFTPGQEVLIIQMQGTGAGNYEFGTIASKNGNTLTLINNLVHGYTVGGNSTAQVLRVMHYRTVTVTGGMLTAHAWDGSTGGILALRALNSFTEETGGSVSANNLGFRGGVMPDTGWTSVGYCGESYTGPSYQSGTPNGGGGPPGCDYQNGGGGGGSYGTLGSLGGGNSCGLGTVYGSPKLDTFFLGSGGGSAGGCCSDGGAGGGGIIIFGRSISVAQLLQARGRDGQNGFDNGKPAAGAGSGGSILLSGKSVALGDGLVTALGGTGGWSENMDNGHRTVGGDGGAGRIHIEYSTLTGNANPTANSEQVNFYIARQLPTGPDADTELYLPDAASSGGGVRYYTQFGQRSANTNGGDQTFSARLPRRGYSNVMLSALVERAAGSGSAFNFCLDLGNDGTCDWTPPVQSFSGPVRLDATITDTVTLAAALTAYIAAHPGTGTDLVVPIRAHIDTPADLFLFNLIATPRADVDLVPGTPSVQAANGAARDNIAEGTPVTLGATLTNTGIYTASDFTVGFYRGQAITDRVLIGSTFVPALGPSRTTTITQAWDTTGLLGLTTLYVTVDATGALTETSRLNNLSSITATLRSKPDLAPVSLTVPDVRAGETVTCSAVISNGGEADVFGAGVTLSLGAPGVQIGVTSVDVRAGQVATATIPWTPAAAGPAMLSVKADPANAIVEALETNNVLSRTVRAGLSAVYIDAGSAGDTAYDPALGYGWTSAGTAVATCGAQPEKTYRQAGSVDSLDYHFDNLLPSRRYHLDLTFGLCSGERWLNASVGGRQVGESALGLVASTPVTTTAHVTTALQTVSILLDPADYAGGAVDLSLRRADGLGGPQVNLVDLREIRYDYRDSGPGEVAWSATTRAGYVADGTSDAFDGWGHSADQTIRFSEGGSVRYRFSGLSPTTDYNLGLTLYEGDGVGRRQQVRFDGTLGPTATLSAAPQRWIVPIPKASYSGDGVVDVTIDRIGAGSAVVSEVALEQITRRYPGVAAPQPTPPPPLTGAPVVELSGFNAVWDAARVRLTWGATTEINNSRFILFRSPDTQAWVQMAEVASQRPCGTYTGVQPLSYVYTDTAVIPGVSYYYRLQYSGATCGLGAAMSLLTAQAPGDKALLHVFLPIIVKQNR